MVNENVVAGANILDFNLENSRAVPTKSVLKCPKVLNPSQDHQSQQNPLQQAQSEQKALSVSFKNSLLTENSNNLSWTFFEQISTLDNQLRSEESNVIPPNACNFMTNSPHHSSAAPIRTTLTVGEQHSGEEGKTIIACKLNGFALAATLNAEANIDALLQQPLDVDVQQLLEQQQQQNTNFKFTSPTATFKRKKQKQQQQQQQEQPNQKDEHKKRAATCSEKELQRLTQSLLSPHKLIADSKCNTISTKTTLNKQQENQQRNAVSSSTATATNTTATTTAAATLSKAMINSAGVIFTDTATTTNIPTIAISSSSLATTATKTRTLPVGATTTTTKRASYADAAGVDLIDKTNIAAAATTTTSGNNNNYKNNNKRRRNKPTISHKQQQQQQQHSTTMGMNASGNSSSSKTATASQQSIVGGIETYLGLLGWRKKCLYALLALLMFLIVTNLVLTLWILKVMELSTQGMGQLKIVPGGIQLTGQTLIMDVLRASTIRSKHGQPIAIESSRNFSINTRDTNGMLENHLFLGHDKLECLSTSFRINDTAGRNLFSVNRNEVTIGAHALKIDGEGGAIFRESIQTPHIRAEPGREFRLESPTRQLELTAAKDINLQSRAGGIELSALADVKLSALDGSLRLDSSKILMPNLRTAQPPLPGATPSRDHVHRVFQLCACSNGKLFLAAPHSICAGDDSTVCR